MFISGANVLIMLLTIFAIYTLFYLTFIFYLKRGWEKIPSTTTESTKECRVSIVITVRNEAQNIKRLLVDLNHQSYDKSRFEIIIFDDHSEDQTRNIIRKFADQSDLNLHLMQLMGGETSPKKKAITKAMKIVTGELVVVTDGDCRVRKDWLQTIVNFHHATRSLFISGPVAFDRSKSFWEKMSNIEFASLIGSGASSFYYKKPIMCNAANMAFLKDTFDEVDGFSGNEDRASGDDVFLMRKIFGKYPDKVNFLKDRKAIVYTKPEDNFSSFLNQRIRWAGKWRQVPGIENTLTPLFIFFFHLCMLITFLTYIGNFASFISFMMLFFTKYLAEKWFLSSVMRFLGKKMGIMYYFAASVIYPVYAVVMALSSLRRKYVWKGKTYYS